MSAALVSYKLSAQLGEAMGSKSRTSHCVEAAPQYLGFFFRRILSFNRQATSSYGPLDGKGRVLAQRSPFLTMNWRGTIARVGKQQRSGKKARGEVSSTLNV